MKIARYTANWLSVAALAGSGFWNVAARADDNGNGNDNGQGNEQVDTIPPGATGKLQRGVQQTKGGPKGTQVKNLIDHGGPVRAASNQYFIWWGTPASFPGDAVNGLSAVAQGMNGSGYLGISQQYMRGSAISSNYVTSASDLSAPPTRGPSTGTIVNEVCKVINLNKWTPDSTALYTVVTSNFPSHVNYCAWHSHGTCNGKDIEIAYLPNASGIAGCDPGNQSACNGASEGTRSMADSYAHEFSEAITDPDLNAWYDSSGSEIGDKCSFVYSACVTLSTGKWQLQEEWSNKISACQQQ